MYPKTLKFRPTSLEEQKVTKVDEAFIILDKEFIHYKAKFYANEPQRDEEGKSDKALPWEEEVFNYFEIFLDRGDIKQLEKGYQPLSKVWCLCIWCSAYADPLKIYTKLEANCDELLAAVKAWRWPASEKQPDSLT